MLNRPSHAVSLLIVGLLALATPRGVLASEEDDGSPPPVWLGSLLLEARSGAAFHEQATGRLWQVGYSAGTAVSLVVMRLAEHRALVGVGYSRPFFLFDDGSEQVRVETTYQRTEAFAGYDFVWKLLSVGARIGFAGTIVSTTTTLYDVHHEIQGESLVFTGRTKVDQNRATGLSPGFLARVGVGIDVGWLLDLTNATIEVRAEGDYVRRGARNDFVAGGTLVFGPIWKTP